MRRLGIGLNEKQAEKISDLAMDLAKAQLIAAIALPFITNSLFDIGKLYLSGILLVGYSLWMVREKEER